MSRSSQCDSVCTLAASTPSAMAVSAIASVGGTTTVARLIAARLSHASSRGTGPGPIRPAAIATSGCTSHSRCTNGTPRRRLINAATTLMSGGSVAATITSGRGPVRPIASVPPR